MLKARISSTSSSSIKIGVSACLLGYCVRYDGGHKLYPFLTETLGPLVTFVPICPEVACGLGVPREAMHLVGNAASPRLMTISSQTDFTRLMLSYCRQIVTTLKQADLDGFILKSRSPSCGLDRIKIYSMQGKPIAPGMGLFAKAMSETFPLIPFENETRLGMPIHREPFIEKVFALKRWRDFKDNERNLGDLVAFHARHKLFLLSHRPAHYRALGALVAKAKTFPKKHLLSQYEAIFLEAVESPATPAKHANVLQHILGYFKKYISTDEKQKLLQIIEGHRLGQIPLIVPRALLSHLAWKYQVPYLLEQVYLTPDPLEDRLKNHA